MCNRAGHRGSSMLGICRAVAKLRAYLPRPVGSAAREKACCRWCKFSLRLARTLAGARRAPKPNRERSADAEGAAPRRLSQNLIANTRALAEQDATEQASGAVVQERSRNWRSVKVDPARSAPPELPSAIPSPPPGQKKFLFSVADRLSPVDSNCPAILTAGFKVGYLR